MAGTTPDVQDTLKEGFDAARDFIAYASRHFRGQRHHFHQMVAEILGHQIAPRPEGEAPELPHFSGLPAERIGMLLLMASLLRALPDKLTPGSEPIWIIEDPEVQLHPMTLASVQNMMRQIKWQKIITTQSGDVLGAEPLKSLRRLTRQGEILREWRVRPRSLSAEDLRRVGYHLRARHSVASFARCWLLVEGETEFWVLPELARIYGHDFAVEGVVCVEFAQCGLRPLIKLARELGIEWHVLADGDRAGQQYVEQARRFLRGDPLQWRVSALHEHDIESCFYEHGYENVFKRLIGEEDLQLPARRVIERAIGRHSKPMLALELVLAASARGPAGIPPPLARTIKTCVTLARAAPRDKRAVPSNP
jgi:putative ATP-dependent endonuclease of OLD family